MNLWDQVWRQYSTTPTPGIKVPSASYRMLCDLMKYLAVKESEVKGSGHMENEAVPALLVEWINGWMDSIIKK